MLRFCVIAVFITSKFAVGTPVYVTGGVTPFVYPLSNSSTIKSVENTTTSSVVNTKNVAAINIIEPGIVVSDCSTNCRRQYIIGLDTVTFDAAVKLCTQTGLEIATISNSQEELQLEQAWRTANRGNLTNHDVWIGGIRSHIGSLSTFEWSNTGKPIVYTNFIPHQPNNVGGNQDCLLVTEYRNVIGWNDWPCDEKRQFACQTRCCWS